MNLGRRQVIYPNIGYKEIGSHSSARLPFPQRKPRQASQTHDFNKAIFSTEMSTQSFWCWCDKCGVLSYFGAQQCPNGGVHDHSDSGMYSLTKGGSNGQSDWQWCSKCNVISYAGSRPGPCVAGDNHDLSSSGNYTIMLDNPASGQPGWKWCKKCQGLNYAGEQTIGDCHAGGIHDNSDSGNYSLSLDGNPAGGQDHWRWCNKCQMLAYDASSCCAAGGVHSSKGSGIYTLPINDSGAPGMFHWRWCNKCYGLVFDARGAPSLGPCSRGGTHDATGSGTYTVPTAAGNNTQEGWCECAACKSLWYEHSENNVCPQSPPGKHTASENSIEYYLPMTS